MKVSLRHRQSVGNGSDRTTRLIRIAAYMAATSFEAALQADVTFGEFTKLLQDFSSAIVIAKGAAKTTQDHEIVERYREVLELYRMSGKLWQLQIEHSSTIWGSEIPVWFRVRAADTSGIEAAERLGITVRDHGEGTLKGVPANAVQFLTLATQVLNS